MKKFGWLIAVFAILLMAACGAAETEGQENNTEDQASEEVGDNNSGEAEAEQEATEIEVSHELGETTVPVNPEKVVVFDFGTLDTLDKLGVEVTAVPQDNLPSYLEKYQGENYQNAGTLFEPDFEKLAEIDPDLIIISGRTSEVYEDLKELAPTIYMGVDTDRYLDSFEENVTLIGEIFQKEEAAKEELASIETAIEDLKETTASKEAKGLIILTNDGSINAYGAGSRFGIIHDEFGVALADEEIEVATHGQNVSFEYVAEKNPDYLFVIDRNQVVGGEYSAEKTLDNDIVNRTTAAENDQIVYLSPDYWYLSGGGLISVAEMVNEIKAGITAE